MEYLLICSVALVVSGLTLFSGFGLGTLLLPAFAVFFPVTVAVSLTAIVHLANNLFKLGLLGREADGPTVARFGIPAVVAALAGAAVLVALSDLQPLHEYSLGGKRHTITPLKLVIALLMAGFAIWDLFPGSEKRTIRPSLLPLGGALSGFFGGLSGHQGALRSAFLVKSGLSGRAFVATGVVIAVLVDFVRIAVYGATFFGSEIRDHLGILAAASGAAFAGAFVGNRVLKKMTLRTIRIIVAVMLLFVAAGLGSGVI